MLLWTLFRCVLDFSVWTIRRVILIFEQLAEKEQNCDSRIHISKDAWCITPGSRNLYQNGMWFVFAKEVRDLVGI